MIHPSLLSMRQSDDLSVSYVALVMLTTLHPVSTSAVHNKGAGCKQWTVRYEETTEIRQHLVEQNSQNKSLLIFEC